jgi:(p)ppGpp synthase/HD superfamily hydrolase
MRKRHKPHVKLSRKFFKAMKYATEAHKKQVRKSTNIAYISHPFGVAALVLESGGDESQAIGALLHDVAQDCGGEPRLRDIYKKFGSRIGDIVRGCTDSLAQEVKERAPWKERKLKHIADLAYASEDVLLVSAADKVHNARAIATDLESVGPEVWKRFDASGAEILWFYTASLKALEDRKVTPTLLKPLFIAISVMEKFVK